MLVVLLPQWLLLLVDSKRDKNHQLRYLSLEACRTTLMPWDGSKLIHTSSLTTSHSQSSLRVASVPSSILYTPVYINTLLVSGTESLGIAIINSSTQSSLRVAFPVICLGGVCPSVRNANRACEQSRGRVQRHPVWQTLWGGGVILWVRPFIVL